MLCQKQRVQTGNYDGRSRLNWKAKVVSDVTIGDTIWEVAKEVTLDIINLKYSED